MTGDDRKTPAPASGTQPAAQSSSADIKTFLSQVKALEPLGKGGPGRLIFALDATMSRQPTWDLACSLQADMFREAGSVGQLAMRLVYYRGENECRATGWITDTGRLAAAMRRISCIGGETQIGRVLADARREASATGVSALVFVGDAMEEGLDELSARAGELGILKVPCFMFQEGHDPAAEVAFRKIARLTGGAWCRFDAGSAEQLRELLRAVAAYATGGLAALQQLASASPGANRLLGQIR